jgi:hypothetical protein
MRPMLRAACLASVVVLCGCPNEVLVLVSDECRDFVEGHCVGERTAKLEELGPCDCAADPVAASGDEELAGALAGGGCVIAAAGTYGSHVVPYGVQLVGEGARVTQLESLVVEGAACKLGVRAGITVPAGALAASLKYVHVQSGASAIVVESDATAVLEGVTAAAAGKYGVEAFDAAAIRVDRTLIVGGGGPGIWAECTGCGCAAPEQLTVLTSLVRDNALLGVSLVGVEAVLADVEIRGTRPDDGFEHGGGMAVSGCAVVAATGLAVVDSADYGVLVDGAVLDVNGARVAGNLRGLWAQHLTGTAAGLTVRNAVFERNRGVGLGIAGSLGDGPVLVQSVDVADTELVGMPCFAGGPGAGSMQVGDGVYWQGASADLRDVTVSSSARVGVLIDGAAAGTLEDVVPDGQSPAIVQVHYASGPQPETVGSTPPILVDDGSILGPDPCR